VHPELARAPLLKEFCIGMTYHELEQMFPLFVLSELPSTTTDMQDTSPLKTGPVQNMCFRCMSGEDSYPRKRYWYTVTKPPPTFVENHPRERYPPGLVNGLATFFGVLDTETHKIPSDLSQFHRFQRENITIVVDEAKRRRVIESLSLMHPNEMSKFSEACATILLRELCFQLHKISKIIFESVVNEPGKQWTEDTLKASALSHFLILECLLIAANELGSAMNEEFLSDFSLIALGSLPRTLMRQYIERGIVVVSWRLIFTMIKKNIHNDDPDFFFFALTRIPEESIYDVLEGVDYEKIPYFLLLHFARRNSWMVSKSIRPNISCCEQSRNIPLQLFISSLSEVKYTSESEPKNKAKFLELLNQFRSFDVNYEQIHFPGSNTTLSSACPADPCSQPAKSC